MCSCRNDKPHTAPQQIDTLALAESHGSRPSSTSIHAPSGDPLADGLRRDHHRYEGKRLFLARKQCFVGKDPLDPFNVLPLQEERKHGIESYTHPLLEPPYRHKQQVSFSPGNEWLASRQLRLSNQHGGRMDKARRLLLLAKPIYLYVRNVSRDCSRIAFDGNNGVLQA